MIKLYYSPGACSLVVRIILNELGLRFDEEKVDLRTKKTANGEDFRAINPKGAVPTLRLDNNEILTENQVILQYLADTTPHQNLLASVGDLKRYRTLEWLNFISTELHKTIGLFFNADISAETKSEVVKPMVLKRLAYINASLDNKAYLMGEALTLPDAYLFVMLRWTMNLKMDVSPYAHLVQFMTRMQSRSAVIKALAQE